MAIDITDEKRKKINGTEIKSEIDGDIKLTEIGILTDEGSKKIGKPIGSYITVEFPEILKIGDTEKLRNKIVEALKILLPDKNQSFLVVGLGNSDITPDSIGPLTAKKILATRHIKGETARKTGLDGLSCVSVLAPGVLGQTGIEASELVGSAVREIKPDSVIVIDSLASRSTERLFKTVQLSNTGISPGSGVKNARKEISEKTLGIPVIAVGIPTVVDVEALAFELTKRESEKHSDMFVTPKEVDLLCEKASLILSEAINIFLQPDTDENIILGLV